MTFEHIINVTLEKYLKKINKKSVSFDCFCTLLTTQNIDINCDKVKRKYNILKNQLFNPLSKEYEKKMVLDFFCMLQKNYFILKRFFFKIYYNRCKFYEPQIDMSLNELKNTKKHLQMILLQNNTKYGFTFSDLINIINTALTYNSGYFCTPQNIKNPYTNLNFSRANLYNIYYSIKDSPFIMPILFHRFFLSNFNLREFGVFNENLIKEATIETILKTNDINKKFGFIKKMLGFYNKYRPINKRITYDNHFPKKELVNIFDEYLHTFLTAFFIQDENVFNHSRIILFKKLDQFKKNNPTFGRLIIRKNVKRLYYISVLNYEHGYNFDKYGTFIPPPYLFNLDKRGIYITSRKKRQYSLFLDKVDVKYETGWDFMKNGTFYMLDERARKIIDAIIRPDIDRECSLSTHSSDNSSSAEEDNSRENRTPIRLIDNIQRDVRNLDYYLNTVNTLFDYDSDSDSEDVAIFPPLPRPLSNIDNNIDEIINNIVNDNTQNDTIIMDEITVGERSMSLDRDSDSDTDDSINIVTENNNTDIINNSNTARENIENRVVTPNSTLINELDANFNVHILNNSIYDLTTDEFNSPEPSPHRTLNPRNP